MSNDYEFRTVDLALLRFSYPAPLVVKWPHTGWKCVGVVAGYSHKTDELVIWLFNPKGEFDLSVPLAQKVVLSRVQIDYDFNLSAFVIDVDYCLSVQGTIY